MASTETLSVIEWLAVGIGLAGSVLWARNSAASKWASALWVVSSLLWIVFAVGNHHHGLLVSNIIMVCIYVYGAKQWLKPPNA